MQFMLKWKLVKTYNQKWNSIQTCWSFCTCYPSNSILMSIWQSNPQITCLSFLPPLQFLIILRFIWIWVWPSAMDFNRLAEIFVRVRLTSYKCHGIVLFACCCCPHMTHPERFYKTYDSFGKTIWVSVCIWH